MLENEQKTLQYLRLYSVLEKTYLQLSKFKLVTYKNYEMVFSIY